MNRKNNKMRKIECHMCVAELEGRLYELQKPKHDGRLLCVCDKHYAEYSELLKKQGRIIVKPEIRIQAEPGVEEVKAKVQSKLFMKLNAKRFMEDLFEEEGL